MGDQGKMLVEGWSGHSPRLLPEQRMRDYRRAAKSLPRSVGHHRNWVKACRTGYATRSRFDFAVPLSEAVLLGTVCVCVGGQKRVWDSEKLQVANVAEANQYLHTEYRPGWPLLLNP